jgi:hypothetical protein
VATNGARSGQAVHVPEVLEEMDYLRRYIAIAADDEDIHAELRAKHAQLADLQSLPLARGLREGYRDEFIDELKGYDTIKYLLDAGHLDQDYPDYLGHFYGHSIGSEDMALVLVLRQGELLDEPAGLIRLPLLDRLGLQLAVRRLGLLALKKHQLTNAAHHELPAPRPAGAKYLRTKGPRLLPPISLASWLISPMAAARAARPILLPPEAGMTV